jgi:hypothetical protein
MRTVRCLYHSKYPEMEGQVNVFIWICILADGIDFTSRGGMEPSVLALYSNEKKKCKSVYFLLFITVFFIYVLFGYYFVGHSYVCKFCCYIYCKSCGAKSIHLRLYIIWLKHPYRKWSLLIYHLLLNKAGLVTPSFSEPTENAIVLVLIIAAIVTARCC